MTTIKDKALAVLITAIIILSSFSAFADSYYVHDPMDNPKAAADIIVNPDAVYGYSPNPDSKRLGAYAQYDWSDEEFVEEMKQQREAYHESMKELYDIKAQMEAEGKSTEEIARAVSTRRNELRIEAYKDDPEGLEALKQSNLETYGNENGGTPDYFYEKYGSWETVIEKAFSTNAGADACLGLYDKYYYTYIIDGTADGGSQSTEQTTESTTASAETTAPTETAESTTASAETTAPTETAESTTVSAQTTVESTSNTNTYEKPPKTGCRQDRLLACSAAVTGIGLIAFFVLGHNARKEEKI